MPAKPDGVPYTFSDLGPSYASMPQAAVMDPFKVEVAESLMKLNNTPPQFKQAPSGIELIAGTTTEWSMPATSDFENNAIYLETLSFSKDFGWITKKNATSIDSVAVSFKPPASLAELSFDMTIVLADKHETIPLSSAAYTIPVTVKEPE